MLREEQIDLRRQRARTGHFQIENAGKNRVFSDFRVTNPETGGQYTVAVRGFEVGDNACTCPDFKSNTLGTCKHVEAVLDHLKDDLPAHLQKKKAPVTRPEIYLHYGEQLRLGIHLPSRHSDLLGKLAASYFDEKGLWSNRGKYRDLIRDVEAIPEDVTFFSDAMDFADREIERADMLAREAEWLSALSNGTLDMQLLNVPLYDFQMEGALFLACRGRSILGDDMGLGKTIQTLAAVELLARERGVRKVLVVAPASVKYQWESEIRKFTNRAVQVIEGGAEERRDLYGTETFYKLVNYEQVVRDREVINEWKPDLVVLDEAQRIKNWESKTSREVKKLQSRYAMVLTGTPVENKLEELYSIVQFVDERRFGPAFQFLHDHRVLDENHNLKGYRNLERIREKLAPVFLRRTRGEVLTQLPSRTDNTVFVELADHQRGPYEDQRAALARLLQKNFLTDLDRKRILAAIVNMRMVCDSLFLLDKQSRVSPKLDEFSELVAGIITEDHKAVVFSQWETMILETAKVLDALGVGYAVLHGGLAGKDRKEALERFKNDPDCKVFLSTDAGGTGLNLQTADTVVNLELPWNPAVLEQRIARVHRMGQSRPVRVVNLVTRGTIEERVLRTLESKQSLFAGIFEGDADEIPFEAVRTSSFLDSMRVLVNGARVPETDTRPVSGDRSQEAGDRSAGDRPVIPSVAIANPIWQGVAQLMEAACATLADPSAAANIPPELREKLQSAARKLSEQLATQRSAR
jgi:SNF2-related domain/Helicase conserved C-terminal domain/SWIM zinc finger